MRSLTSAAIILLLSFGTAFAQRGGFRGGFSGGRFRSPGAGFHRGIGHRGFIGNRGFHGGVRIRIGSPARHRIFFHNRNRFFFHNRKFFHGGSGFGFGFGSFIPFSYVLPVYPTYYGSPYITDYSYTPYSLGYPAVTEVIAPPAYTAPANPVIVNQGFTSPIIRESSPLVYEPKRSEPTRSPPEEQTSEAIYLIAMKDNVIRPALAYWVENGTLNYVGLDRKQRKISIAEIDRDLSIQLNRERGLQFRLPAEP